MTSGRSRIAGAYGCEHDDDPSACAQSGRGAGAESGGPAGSEIMRMTALLAGRGPHVVGSGAGE